jgi:hypothetical protein
MSHAHDFDPLSGWCSRCGYRNDGRLIDLNSGTEYRPGPDYSPAELREYHQWLDQMTGSRTLA